MRISSLALVLALAACEESKSEAPAGETIACALDGAAEFAQACSVERAGPQITVRRPDGGFRRFEVVADGGIATLDGADNARATVLANGLVEVQVESDRYRFNIEAQGSAPRP